MSAEATGFPLPNAENTPLGASLESFESAQKDFIVSTAVWFHRPMEPTLDNLAEKGETFFEAFQGLIETVVHDDEMEPFEKANIMSGVFVNSSTIRGYNFQKLEPEKKFSYQKLSLHLIAEAMCSDLEILSADEIVDKVVKSYAVPLNEDIGLLFKGAKRSPKATAYRVHDRLSSNSDDLAKLSLAVTIGNLLSYATLKLFNQGTNGR